MSACEPQTSDLRFVKIKHCGGLASLVKTTFLPALRHNPTYASSPIKVSNIKIASNLERAGTSRAVHIVDVVSFSLCPKRAACGPTGSTQLIQIWNGLIQFLGDAGLKLNAFTTIPYTTEFEYPSHLFRILLLRRLRLHLPLSARFCRCRRPLDPLGDHRVPLFLPMQQPLPSLPVFCLKIFPATTTLTEIFRPSANSSPTPAQLCRPVDSQPSTVEEGLDLYLPYQKHIWRLASINTVCAWRLPSKTALNQRTFLRF